MLHVIELLLGSLDCARDPGVTSCPPGEEFEVWSGLVLVTLQTVIEAPIWLIIVLACDPTPNAELQKVTILTINKSKSISKSLNVKSKMGTSTSDFDLLITIK